MSGRWRRSCTASLCFETESLTVLVICSSLLPGVEGGRGGLVQETESGLWIEWGVFTAATFPVGRGDCFSYERVTSVNSVPL